MTASTQQTGIDELLSALTEVREAAEIELPKSETEEAIEQLRVAYLGKKGKLSGTLRLMGDSPKKKDHRQVKLRMRCEIVSPRCWPKTYKELRMPVDKQSCDKD